MSNQADTVLTVISPEYFPRISTLARVQAADVVIWADTFLFSKQTTMNRTRIKTVTGPEWLTVPVMHQGKTRYHDVEIDPEHCWRHNHSRTLQVNYMNSPYYFFLKPELDALIEKRRRHLASLTFSSFLFLCEKMRIRPEIVKGSDCPPVSERSRRVCTWLETWGCGTYLVDADDLCFIDSDYIIRQGYSVSEFSGSSPVYPQVFEHFYPNLSGLDMLFNTGEQSRSLLKKSFQTVPVAP